MRVPPGETGGGKRWLKWLAAIAAVLLLLGLLVTSGEPSVPAVGAPTARSVEAGREALSQLRDAQDSGGASTPVRFDDAALNGLASLASGGSGVERISAGVRNGRFEAAASLPLFWGRWLNGSVAVEGTHEGFPPVRVRLGSLPLPGWAGRAGIEIARRIVRGRGVEVPPLGEIVQSVSVGKDEIRAVLRLPKHRGLVRGLMGLRSKPLDVEATRGAYCALAAAQREAPSAELAAHVRRAFGRGESSVDANRAAFVALAMLAVGERMDKYLPAAADVRKACGKVDTALLLAGRGDLAKHWTLSAALAALFGNDAAGSAGVWKELSDSLPDGSGFSFVDVAANRSGLHAARMATSKATASDARAGLALATEAQLLPIALLAAQEGMSERQFLDRYQGVDQAQYQDMVRWIDQELARAGAFGTRR
jgi:hypothetical protein